MRHVHPSQKVKVGVIGATGYSGIELLHLLERHPGVELAFAASDQRAGQTLSSVIGSESKLAFCTRDEARGLLRGLSSSANATLWQPLPKSLANG